MKAKANATPTKDVATVAAAKAKLAASADGECTALAGSRSVLWFLPLSQCI